MAAQITFTCTSCGFSVESWDDGNPYIEGPDGKRHHFYHPCEDQQIRKIVSKIIAHSPDENEIEEMLRLHAGNESDYICLECLKFCKRDGLKDELRCSSCRSASIVNPSALGGQACPSCHKGAFDEGRMTSVS